MSKRIPLAVGLLLVALTACQATGTGVAITKSGKKASVRAARPTSTPPAGVVTQPGQATPTPSPATPGPTGSPSPAATGTPGTGPSIFRPSKAPDQPIPSGYVSALPDSAFPSPEPTPVPTTTPVPTATPVPTPTPPLQDATVVTNSLPFGGGELTGYVVEPKPGAPGEYRPVSNVTIAITSAEDTTKKATLKNGANGTYRLPEVALGAYHVRAEKSGYAADSAPTTVRIYPGYQSGHTVFLIMPEQPIPQ